MKHVFGVSGLGFAALFVAVFFTGRLDYKHLAMTEKRGMTAREAAVLVLAGQAKEGPTSPSKDW